MDARQMESLLSDYKRFSARRDMLYQEISLTREQLESEKKMAELHALQPSRDPLAVRDPVPADPTAKAALLFAAGIQPLPVRELEDRLVRMESELRMNETLCRYTEILLKVLTDRELLVIDRHLIAGETYENTIRAFALRWPRDAVQSRDGMRRIKNQAIRKMLSIAKDSRLSVYGLRPGPFPSGSGSDAG